MLILSRTPDVTPFGEFMILLIHYIYIITEFVSIYLDYVYGLLTTDYCLHGLVWLLCLGLILLYASTADAVG